MKTDNKQTKGIVSQLKHSYHIKEQLYGFSDTKIILVYGDKNKKDYTINVYIL